MKDALKVKEQLGLTWREVALKGLEMTPEHRQIGRPPQPKNHKSNQDTAFLTNLMNIRFGEQSILRQIMIVKEVSGALMHDGLLIPVIQKHFEFAPDNKDDLFPFYYAVDKVIEAEEKMGLTGEHKDWPAMGIEGLSTCLGHASIASSSSWPENVFSDIAYGRQILREHTRSEISPVLLVSHELYAKLELVAWSPPIEHPKLQPQTYANILLEQRYVTKIFPTNNLLTKNGQRNSALLYQPSRENVLISAMRPKIALEAVENMKKGYIREAIVPLIKDPKMVVEITYIETS